MATPETTEPGSDAYKIMRKAGGNLNTILALMILGGVGVGGGKAWSVGSSVDEVAKNHAEAAQKHESQLNLLTRTQGEVSSKVDTMTSLFTQVLTSQGKLEAAQASLAKSQDDLRVEIASLKSAGTEGKVRDMDQILRKQGEDIAELKALLREKK